MIIVVLWKGKLIAAAKDKNKAFDNACSCIKRNYPDQDLQEVIKEVQFEEYENIEALFKANVLP